MKILYPHENEKATNDQPNFKYRPKLWKYICYLIYTKLKLWDTEKQKNTPFVQYALNISALGDEYNERFDNVYF